MSIALLHFPKLAFVVRKSPAGQASERVRKRLQELLRWRGVKQAQLARRLKRSEDWVSRRLTGRGDIYADDIEQFAEALNVSPCALVDDGELNRALATSLRHVAEEPAQYVVKGLDQRDVQLLADFIDFQRRREQPA